MKEAEKPVTEQTVQLFRCLVCFHPWAGRVAEPSQRRCSDCRSRKVIKEEVWLAALTKTRALVSLMDKRDVPVLIFPEVLESLASTLPDPFLPPKLLRKLISEVNED